MVPSGGFLNGQPLSWWFLACPLFSFFPFHMVHKIHYVHNYPMTNDNGLRETENDLIPPPLHR